MTQATTQLRADPETTQTFLSRCIADENARRRFVEFLADDIRFVADRGPSRWSVTQGEDRLSFNVGTCLALRLYSQNVWVTLLESELPAALAQLLLQRGEKQKAFASVSGSTSFLVPTDVFLEHAPALLEAHRSFILRAVATAKQAPWARFHSPGAIAFFRSYLDQPVPDPVYDSSPEDRVPVWGIHGGRKGEAEQLFERKSVVALGFRPMGDVSALRSRADFREAAARVFPDKSPGSVTVAGDQLYRFVREAQVGDLIVSPSKARRIVRVGQIIGEYEYAKDDAEFFPQRRAVEWITEIPRDSLSVKAQNEISAMLSFFQIRTSADAFRMPAAHLRMAADGGEPEEADASGSIRLSGVSILTGPVVDYARTLARWLAHLDSAPQNANEYSRWIAEEAGVTSVRSGGMVRLIRNLGFAVDDGDQFRASDLGRQFAAKVDTQLLFERLRLAFSGFEETLRFFDENPGARVADLFPALNATLGLNWKTFAMPRARAYWLVACGALELDHGRFTITDLGKQLLDALPAEVGILASAGDDSEDEEEELARVTTSRFRFVPSQVDTGTLVLPEGVLERCCAALTSGKHLLLVGPPGTGKSTLGELLANHAQKLGVCTEPLTATASADWTTYDTIGGWTQRSDQTLTFREGVVTRALRERRWLVLDEVNRADIDKCFGELFTVLAGGTATTPYSHEWAGRERTVTIGRDEEPFNFGPWFRLIATMNVRDKSSLYRLSYAFMRRFAVISVPALGDAALKQLAQKSDAEPECIDLAIRALSLRDGLGKYAPLGPSLLLDVLSYTRSRSEAGHVRAVAEGLELLVFPQLEGLEAPQAEAAAVLLSTIFAAEPSVASSVRAAFQSGFPHVFGDV